MITRLIILLVAASCVITYTAGEDDVEDCHTWSIAANIHNAVVNEVDTSSDPCSGNPDLSWLASAISRAPDNCNLTIIDAYLSKLDLYCSSNGQERRLADCDVADPCTTGVPTDCEANTYNVLECSKEFGAGSCFAESSLAVPFYNKVYDNTSVYTLKYGCCTEYAIQISNPYINEECTVAQFPMFYEVSDGVVISDMISSERDVNDVNITSTDGSIYAVRLTKSLYNTLSPLSLSIVLNFTSGENTAKTELVTSASSSGDVDGIESRASVYLMDTRDAGNMLEIGQALFPLKDSIEDVVELVQLLQFKSGIKSSIDIPIEGDIIGRNRLMNCSSEIVTASDASFLECFIDDTISSVTTAIDPETTSSSLAIDIETQAILFQENRRRALADTLTGDDCFGFLACIALPDSSSSVKSSYNYSITDGVLSSLQIDRGEHAYSQQDGEDDITFLVTITTPETLLDSLPTSTRQQAYSQAIVDPPDVLDFELYYIGNIDPPLRRLLIESSALGVRNRSGSHVVDTIVDQSNDATSMLMPLLTEEHFGHSDVVKATSSYPLSRLTDNMTVSYYTHLSAETFTTENFERTKTIQFIKTDQFIVNAADIEICLLDETLVGLTSAGVVLYSVQGEVYIPFRFTSTCNEVSFENDVIIKIWRNIPNLESATQFLVQVDEITSAMQVKWGICTGVNEVQVNYTNTEKNIIGSLELSGSDSILQVDQSIEFAPLTTEFEIKLPMVFTVDGLLTLQVNGSDWWLYIELMNDADGSNGNGDVTLSKTSNGELIVTTSLVVNEVWTCKYKYETNDMSTIGSSQVFNIEQVIINILVSSPTQSPTNSPTIKPTSTSPTTVTPTLNPTPIPTTIAPTLNPTPVPSVNPTSIPSINPTSMSSANPTSVPPSIPVTNAPTSKVTGWVAGRLLRA